MEERQDLISRQAAIVALDVLCQEHRYKIPGKRETYSEYNEAWQDALDRAEQLIFNLPSAQQEGWVKIPDTGIDDLSDGSHTFRQLYYQRMMLFAAIVRQNREKAWKSLRHEDGELCFGGGWFIVGIDTPEGSYTYHYKDSFYSLFDCEELECAKHWDGHTEKDVTRLLSLPSAQPERKKGKWDEKEVIEDGNIIKEWQSARCSVCGRYHTTPYMYYFDNYNYCPNCGADMRGGQDETD